MLNTTTIEPWRDIAKQHPYTYKVLGVYQTGAAKLKGHYGYNDRIGFLDCPVCHGEGEIKITRGHYGWTCSDSYEQCAACAVRFGMKEYIVKRAKALIEEVKQDLKNAKWEGINVKDPGFIQDYNTQDPHAAKYRRLLYALWSYQEPEYIELVKN